MDRYLSRTVRRDGMGEGVVVGRIVYEGESKGWLRIACYDGLERQSPENRVILCPEYRLPIASSLTVTEG